VNATCTVRSSRIAIAAMPPVASNLQTTTNNGLAVNARRQDQLMAEQENGGKMLDGFVRPRQAR
jgi:hypothetical protein